MEPPNPNDFPCLPKLPLHAEPSICNNNSVNMWMDGMMQWVLEQEALVAGLMLKKELNIAIDHERELI